MWNLTVFQDHLSNLCKSDDKFRQTVAPKGQFHDVRTYGIMLATNADAVFATAMNVIVVYSNCCILD